MFSKIGYDCLEIRKLHNFKLSGITLQYIQNQLEIKEGKIMMIIKAKIAVLLAALMVMCTSVFTIMPSKALAANSVNNNYAYVNEGNLENQTIVGEEDGNSVVVTNNLPDDAITPTGIQLGSVTGVGAAIVVLGGAFIFVNRKRAAIRKENR